MAVYKANKTAENKFVVDTFLRLEDIRYSNNYNCVGSPGAGHGSLVSGRLMNLDDGVPGQRQTQSAGIGASTNAEEPNKKLKGKELIALMKSTLFGDVLKPGRRTEASTKLRYAKL